MSLKYAFIVPVYNRPEEVKALLESLVSLKGQFLFEVLIIEDGSSETSKNIVDHYQDLLDVKYHYKKNTGPGDSRNYGMSISVADYFIILDSDVSLPSHYLLAVDKALTKSYYDCFGGPDSSNKDFSVIQKAIDFAMTSFLTTGGLRGSKKAKHSSYEPRSFNMGISKEAFLASKGFGNIHPGEDPDLSIRLKKLGFKIGFIEEAYVYHKRRISFKKFYQQVFKFGTVRPILLKWHKSSTKLTYFFPTCFCFGLIFSLVLLPFSVYFTGIYLFYFIILFGVSAFKHRSFLVALYSVLAVMIQFFGYGFAFLISYTQIIIFKKNPEVIYPNLFFK